MSDGLRLPLDVALPTDMDPTLRATLTDAFRRIITQVNRTAQRTITVTADHTAAEDLVLADATSGNVTVTLPKVATWVDKTICVKRTDGSANTVTIAPASGDGSILDGFAPTASVTGQYDAWTFMSDGANWWIVSNYA